ncbi:hypothetical protein G9A89_001719, partial [Geosiphon pyriformis]
MTDSDFWKPVAFHGEEASSSDRLILLTFGHLKSIKMFSKLLWNAARIKEHKKFQNIQICNGDQKANLVMRRIRKIIMRRMMMVTKKIC